MGTRNDAREGQQEHVGFSASKEVDCDVIVIDDYLPNLTEVSLIKCDIEGAGLFALRGAAKAIDRNHPTVICEINPWFLDGFGLSVARTLSISSTSAAIRSYRYKCGQLHPIAWLNGLTKITLSLSIPPVAEPAGHWSLSATSCMSHSAI